MPAANTLVLVSPISSSAFYLVDKTGPQIPDFNIVKENLLRDFEYENQKSLNDQIFKELKKNYEIKFNLDEDKFDSEFIDFLMSEVKS